MVRGKSVEYGREAESAAARFLRRKGFRILARNYRSPYGEIDLVAQDGGAIVFIEVKSRAGLEHGDPREVVNGPKMRRIGRAAAHYIRRFGLEERECRFDVLAFAGGKATEHVKGAFEYNG